MDLTLAREIFDLLAEGVLVAEVGDEAGTILFANRAAHEMLGEIDDGVSPPEWSKRYGLFAADGVTPFPAAAIPLARALRGEGTNGPVEVVIRRPDGTRLHTIGRAVAIGDHAVAIIADVTAARRAEAGERRAERRYRTLVENLNGIAALLFDESLTYVLAGGAPLVAHGDATREVVGHPVGFEIAEAEDRERLRAACRAALRGDETRALVLRVHGRIYELTVSPARDERGGIVEGLILSRDITEERRLASGYRRQAQLDPLTKLANTTTFQAVVGELLARDEPPALVFVDLDDFGTVNKRFDQLAGDRVLVNVATRLRAAVREGVDVVGRIGGDEFAVVLPTATAGAAMRAAERIVEALAAEPIDLGDGRLIEATASVGVALARVGPLETYDTLLARANVAAKRAKREGKNRACIAP